MNDLDVGRAVTAVTSILIEEALGFHTINRSSGGQVCHERLFKPFEMPAILFHFVEWIWLKDVEMMIQDDSSFRSTHLLL